MEAWCQFNSAFEGCRRLASLVQGIVTAAKKIKDSRFFVSALDSHTTISNHLNIVVDGRFLEFAFRFYIGSFRARLSPLPGFIRQPVNLLSGISRFCLTDLFYEQLLQPYD